MNKTENNDYSEEIQDIIERMPAYWCTWIACVTLVIISLLIAAGFLIKYPDTISGTIIIREGQHTVRIVSPSAGRLHLLQKNHNYVHEGDFIAYIENGASFSDMMLLDSICKCLGECDSSFTFPKNMALGELSSTYSSLVLAYQNYDIARHTHIFDNMRQGLISKIEADSHNANFLKEEAALHRQIVDYSKKHLFLDSIIMVSDGMSREQYEEQRQILLQKEIAEIEVHNSYSTYISDINKNKIEIDRIDLEEQEKRTTAHSTFLQACNDMRNAIRIWKEHYLIRASISGKIEYLGFWSQNTFVSSTQELFSILPSNRGYFGEMCISAVGAGKVSMGQTVNVKVHNFPYNEYGFVKGYVTDISNIAGTPQSEAEPQAGIYRVHISFPNAMHTNYDKDLNINYEASGIADIVVARKRLIERLFDNLKSKENK